MYLRVSADAYLGVSVTARLCACAGSRVFHVCCVYEDLCCVSVCVLRTQQCLLCTHLGFVSGFVSVFVTPLGTCVLYKRVISVNGGLCDRK